MTDYQMAREEVLEVLVANDFEFLDYHVMTDAELLMHLDAVIYAAVGTAPELVLLRDEFKELSNEQH